MDQKPVGRVGPIVDFLGQPTEFVAGPAAMAIKTKAPVLGVYCVREAPFTYRVITDPIDVNLMALEDRQTELTKGDREQLLTQQMANSIAKVITLYPEQWSWSYKRWRFSEVGRVNANLSRTTVE